MRNKQRRFAQEYVQDHNASEAAIRSGYKEAYSKQEGYRLLQEPQVQRYIKRLSKRIVKRNEITEDYIIQTLLKVIAKGLGEDYTNTVVKDGLGGGLSHTLSMKLKKDDLSAVKGAAELLGRYKGMFTDKSEVKHSGQILRRIVNVNPTKGT